MSGIAQGFWGHCQLFFFDEVKLLGSLHIDHLFYKPDLFRINQIDEHVAQGYQIIPPGGMLELKLIMACEEHIPLELGFCVLFDMLAINFV